MPSIREIFETRAQGTWMFLLDAAGIDAAVNWLQRIEGIEFECLLLGQEADVQALAPYIAVMTDPMRATAAIEAIWGRDAVVLMHTRLDISLLAAKNHFRKLNIAYLPGGKAVFFRYYDPRVLRMVLPRLESNQLDVVFGAFETFIIPGDGHRLPRLFSRQAGKLTTSTVNIRMEASSC